MSIYPRFLPLGDSALTVEFANAIDPAINASVQALDRAIAASNLPGIIETAPSFRSLLIIYEPETIGAEALVDELRRLIGDGLNARIAAGRSWTVPVAYGCPTDADLLEVCRRDRVVLRGGHRGSQRRRVSGLLRGFVPGLPVLGGLPPALHLPRRPDPRPGIEAGCVMIGGMQGLIVPDDDAERLVHPGADAAARRITPARTIHSCSARATGSGFADHRARVGRVGLGCLAKGSWTLGADRDAVAASRDRTDAFGHRPGWRATRMAALRRVCFRCDGPDVAGDRQRAGGQPADRGGIGIRSCGRRMAGGCAELSDRGGWRFVWHHRGWRRTARIQLHDAEPGGNDCTSGAPLTRCGAISRSPAASTSRRSSVAARHMSEPASAAGTGASFSRATRCHCARQRRWMNRNDRSRHRMLRTGRIAWCLDRRMITSAKHPSPHS